MSQKPEAWGGEVRLPRWLSHALKRQGRTDTPEAAHEGRKPDRSDYQRLERMRAQGTLGFHPSELPRPEPAPRQRGDQGRRGGR
jgi:hypothetical protein